MDVDINAQGYRQGDPYICINIWDLGSNSKEFSMMFFSALLLIEGLTQQLLSSTWSDD